MFIVIDNFDSISYNLFHFLSELGVSVLVVRNDSLSVQEILSLKPQGIVLSPGSCVPEDAGVCIELVHQASGRVPILGMCLGHRVIGSAYGGVIAPTYKFCGAHTERIHHRGSGIFRGLENDFTVARYDTPVLSADSVPTELEVTANSEDGTIMGVMHKVHPVHGVQFRPESMSSDLGHSLLQNFLQLSADFSCVSA